MSLDCSLCDTHYTSSWELTEHLISVSHHIKWKQDQSAKGINSPRHSCIVCKADSADVSTYVKHVASIGHKTRLNSLRVRQSVIEDAGLQLTSPAESLYSISIKMPKNKKSYRRSNDKDSMRKNPGVGTSVGHTGGYNTINNRVPEIPPYGRQFFLGEPAQFNVGPHVPPPYYERRNDQDYRGNRKPVFDEYRSRELVDRRYGDERRHNEDDRPYSRGSYRSREDFRGPREEMRIRRDDRQDWRRPNRDFKEEDVNSRSRSRPPEHSSSFSRHSSEHQRKHSRASEGPAPQDDRSRPHSSEIQSGSHVNNGDRRSSTSLPQTEVVQPNVIPPLSKEPSISEPESATATANTNNSVGLLREIKQEEVEKQKKDKSPIRIVASEKKGYEKRGSNSIQSFLNKKSQKMMATRMKQYSLGGQSVLDAAPEQSDSSDDDEGSVVRRTLESIKRIGPNAPTTGLEILQASSPTQTGLESKKRKRLPDTIEEFVETHGNNPPSKKKIHQMADKMLKQFGKDRQMEQRTRTISVNSNNSQNSVTKKTLHHPLNQDDTSSDSDDDKPVVDLRKPKNTRPESSIPSDPVPSAVVIKPDPFAAMEQARFGLDEEAAEAIRRYEESKRKSPHQKSHPPVIVHQSSPITPAVALPTPPEKKQRQRKSKQTRPEDGQDHLMIMWKLAESETAIQEQLERLNREEEKCEVMVQNAIKKRDALVKQKEELANKIRTIHQNKKKLLKGAKR